LFFNYKKYFSIALLAFVDANCKFLIIDVGSYGREGDSGIFNKTTIGQQILQGCFNFPEVRLFPVQMLLLEMKHFGFIRIL